MNDDAKAAIGTVLFALLLGFLLRALSACGHSPAPLPPEREVEIVTPYCLVTVVQVDGEDVDFTLCASTMAACGKAYHSLMAAGAYGVLSVGECSEQAWW